MVNAWIGMQSLFAPWVISQLIHTPGLLQNTESHQVSLLPGTHSSLPPLVLALWWGHTLYPLMQGFCSTLPPWCSPLHYPPRYFLLSPSWSSLHPMVWIVLPPSGFFMTTSTGSVFFFYPSWAPLPYQPPVCALYCHLVALSCNTTSATAPGTF